MALKRFAFNHLQIEGGNDISNGVVEIENNRVVSFYHFEHELPFTQWIGGTATIKRTSVGMLAFLSNNRLLVG